MNYSHVLGSQIKVIVDRPLGSHHPDFPDMIYPVNYGYIPSVIAGDGEEQDAYVLGVDEPISEIDGTVIAVIHRLDDSEDKWIVSPCGMKFTKDAIRALVNFQEQYFKINIITI